MSPDPALIEATGILTAMFVQRLLSTILAVIVSVIVLWWLLSDGAGTALLNAIEGAILWPLALGGLIAVAIQIVRAWRFALLWEGGFGLSSISMIGIATKLVLFNFLLPFKLGELSFPLMMKRAYGTSLGQGAGILILCRLLDLGAVTAIIALAAAWLLDPASHGLSPSLIGIFGLAAFVIPFILVDQLPRLRRAAAKSQRFDHLAGQMSHGAAMMRPFRQRILSAVLTLSIWLAHAVIAWLVAIAVGEAVGFLPMAMASASSNLAFALPISGVAGLGPPQAAWATMLHLAGHDWDPAITTALLCHGLLLITLSTFGAAFWIGQAFRAEGLINAGAPGEGSTSSERSR